jgi:hypothetical protein
MERDITEPARSMVPHLIMLPDRYSQYGSAFPLCHSTGSSRPGAPHSGHGRTGTDTSAADICPLCHNAPVAQHLAQSENGNEGDGSEEEETGGAGKRVIGSSSWIERIAQRRFMYG